MALAFVDDFRDPARAQALAARIARRTTRPWTIMEVCGGQTHAIVRYGIEALLPDTIKLLHGPGCPVCVTPQPVIDRAIALALDHHVTLCCFGDMMRVPGHRGSLQAARGQGADVRVVYSPLDAVALAEREPHRHVVFLAVGFETTAPAHALAIRRAHDTGLSNFSVLSAQVLIPPAMAAVLAPGGAQVQGFLAAGHVCTVTGNSAYHALAATYRVPIVVTGFEPLDILRGILSCVELLEAGRVEVVNEYARSVREGGNPAARALVDEVFQIVDAEWRGLGVIPRSGLRLADEYRDLDAEARFALSDATEAEPSSCPSGDVLRGVLDPRACPLFGTICTPEHPLGATMVSGEGACAAYFHYGRRVAALPRGETQR